MIDTEAPLLTTPEKAECRRTTPVASENDAEAQTVTAEVAPPKAKVGGAAKPAAMVMALSAAAGSDQGTYEATPLAASSTWSAGGSNGDFTWNYPLETPPAPAGPAPNLSNNRRCRRHPEARNRRAPVGSRPAGTEVAAGCRSRTERRRPTLSRTVKSLKGIRNPGNADSEPMVFFLCKKARTVHKVPARFPPICPQNGMRRALRERLRAGNGAAQAA